MRQRRRWNASRDAGLLSMASTLLNDAVSIYFLDAILGGRVRRLVVRWLQNGDGWRIV